MMGVKEKTLIFKYVLIIKRKSVDVSGCQREY